MSKDNVLIIGSGGREHALAWKISQSKQVKKVFVAPGNDGMNSTDNVEIINIKETDFQSLSDFAINKSIALVIIGPEGPLSLGIVDYLQNKKIKVLGPSQFASQLESSKIFSKRFMIDHNIPTAHFEYYDNYENAKKALSKWEIIDRGIVIKADGLASGKGVVVTHDRQEAEKCLYDFMVNAKCSVKTKNIIFEEKLEGKEISFFALSDGENFVNLGYACDYKRLLDNDNGPNTGGMGGYTPENWPSPDLIQEIEQNVFEKTITGMKRLGHPFKGFLFAGLMIKNNKINVLEYNVRFGDPEAQIILPTITNDLYPLLKCASNNQLAHNYYHKDNLIKSVHIVLTSGEYPSTLGTPMILNQEINIDPLLSEFKNTHLFYSGVKKSNNNYINTGGRVLGITCTADTINIARENAYKAIGKIKFNKAHWRTDIASN